MGFYLEGNTGDERLPRLTLAPGTYEIGRSPDCDLVIPDDYVSRQQFTIQVAPERIRSCTSAAIIITSWAEGGPTCRRTPTCNTT